MIALAGQAPHDEQFAARAAAGVLGLDPLAAVIGQADRTQDRDRTHHRPGRGGDDHPALRLGPKGVRQRLLAQRAKLDRPDAGRVAHATLVHLLIHASWLNQVEIYFSILQRKAIKPGRLRRPGRPRRADPGLLVHYNAAAAPFDWTYTRDDLKAFLKRLTYHDSELELNQAA